MVKESLLRSRAALLSLAVGLLVMALKFLAYKQTGSTAILSDALESVVNVTAAAFTLWAVQAAEAPPDTEHPYGHGKLEFVTAIFEGGLITFAALIIGVEATKSFFEPSHGHDLTQGLYVIAGAGALNALLGFWLVRTGKMTDSIALTADGKHVLSDSLTTAGILIGLAIAKFTNLTWIDPALALIVAILLGATGVPLLRQAINGLIDAADQPLLEKLLQAFEANRTPGIIRLHHVRAMKNGRRIHIDGHIVVPEFWSVEEAHDRVEEYQAEVGQIFRESEIELHLDPCRRVYCKSCDLEPCPIRAEPFQHRPPLNLTELQSMVDITDRPKG